MSTVGGLREPGERRVLALDPADSVGREFALRPTELPRRAHENIGESATLLRTPEDIGESATLLRTPEDIGESATRIEDIGALATLLPTPEDIGDSATLLRPPGATGWGVGAGSSPPRIGRPKTIGRYVILDTVGRGGMGLVLRAFDLELERPIALKILLDDIGERHAARLRREAQALAKLSHPNVVQVYEVGVFEGRTFVAMELIQGQTARDWIRQEPRRDWRACVEMFMQLGQGLRAAHAKDLVHRDFKPGNAIIDEQGRARVLDFGLVRRAEDRTVDGSDADTRRDETEHLSTLSLDASLTRTGALLGTPAYMPPEQLAGSHADARSDQFSYCVSLYEALYGERPFPGSSVDALLKSIRAGRIRPPSDGRMVPPSIRKALLRGLNAEPDLRWPSMDALLEELQRLLTPPVRRFVPLSITLGVVALGGSVAFGQYVRVRERCTGARAELTEVWDEGRKRAVEAGLLGTRLSYAPETWERVEQRLDEYAERWVDKRTEICAATSVRQEQSAAVMDLRMSCMAKRRVDLRATVDVLIDADAKVVESAVALTTELPRLSRCDDVDSLRAVVPPPEDPEVARDVESIRQRLAELRVDQRVDRAVAALEEVGPLVVRAEALGYEPLVMEAKLRRGELRLVNGQYGEAEDDVLQVYERAMEHQHHEVALAAVQQLAFVVGVRQARYNEGGVWGRAAMAHAAHNGDEVQRAHSMMRLGSVLRRQGDYEQARHVLERSLQLTEEVLGLGELRVAGVVNELANVLIKQGELDAAERHYRRVLQIREEALGAGHPYVADSLSNLGVLLLERGTYDEAERDFRRSLRIRERALRADHPHLAASLNNLGEALRAQGKHEEAQRSYERAVSILEQALGGEHPDVAALLNNLAISLGAQGKRERAMEQRERALQIRENALGPDHPEVGMSLYNLGSTHVDAGEYEQAVVRLERALKIYEASLGSEHTALAFPLASLAEVARAQGDYTAARAYAERSVALRDEGKAPPELLAESRFELVHALWPTLSQRPRALQLAQLARDAFAEHGDGREEDLAAVERWLSEHAQQQDAPRPVL